MGTNPFFFWVFGGFCVQVLVFIVSFWKVRGAVISLFFFFFGGGLKGGNKLFFFFLNFGRGGRV